MIKNNLLFMLLFFAVTVKSQCNIVGRNTLTSTEPSNYYLETNTAQCSDCHQWKVLGNGAVIEGNNRQNTVRIKATSSGSFVLSLGYLSDSGYQQCSKNVDIILGSNFENQSVSAQNPTSSVSQNTNVVTQTPVQTSQSIVQNNVPQQTTVQQPVQQQIPQQSAPSQSQSSSAGVDCGVITKDLKEIRMGDNSMSFFPMPMEDDGSTYKWRVQYNNGDVKNSDEKIPQFEFSKENGIVKVTVYITKNTCQKELNKVYEPTFWVTF